MINIELADTFLNEIQPGATVLFVDDDNQLPAIGAGNFLHDITHSEGISTVELTEVFVKRVPKAHPVFPPFYQGNNHALCRGAGRFSDCLYPTPASSATDWDNLGVRYAKNSRAVSDRKSIPGA